MLSVEHLRKKPLSNSNFQSATRVHTLRPKYKYTADSSSKDFDVLGSFFRGDDFPLHGNSTHHPLGRCLKNNTLCTEETLCIPRVSQMPTNNLSCINSHRPWTFRDMKQDKCDLGKSWAAIKAKPPSLDTVSQGSFAAPVQNNSSRDVQAVLTAQASCKNPQTVSNSVLSEEHRNPLETKHHGRVLSTGQTWWHMEIQNVLC